MWRTMELALEPKADEECYRFALEFGEWLELEALKRLREWGQEFA